MAFKAIALTAVLLGQSVVAAPFAAKALGSGLEKRFALLSDQWATETEVGR